MRPFVIALCLLSTPAVAGELHVVDGDTVRDAQENYRLLGFDTPETWYARCAREKALGEAAKLRLILALQMARKVEMRHKWRRDRYGRILARMLVDGRDVRDIMIDEGFGRDYHGGRRGGWCAR